MPYDQPENPNIAIQKRFVAAVFGNDADTIRGLCHDEFELCEGSGLPFAGTYRGADGFLSFLTIFDRTFDVERLEPVRTFVTEDPDIIACEFDLRARLRADGRPFASSLVELWAFRDGQVLWMRPHYFNAVN